MHHKAAKAKLCQKAATLCRLAQGSKTTVDA
jgi:hypothetical protein